MKVKTPGSFCFLLLFSIEIFRNSFFPLYFQAALEGAQPFTAEFEVALSGVALMAFTRKAQVGHLFGDRRKTGWKKTGEKGGGWKIGFWTEISIVQLFFFACEIVIL